MASNSSGVTSILGLVSGRSSTSGSVPIIVLMGNPPSSRALNPSSIPGARPSRQIVRPARAASRASSPAQSRPACRRMVVPSEHRDRTIGPSPDPDERSQNESRPRGSPPSRVIKARRTTGAIDFLMYLTAPSAKTALKPSGVNPPSSGKGPLGSKGMSSGLVQGISRCASTARMVFEVPSVMSAMPGPAGTAAAFAPPGTAPFGPIMPAAPPAGPWPGPTLSTVDGPVKTKYELLVGLDGEPSGPG